MMPPLHDRSNRTTALTIDELEQRRLAWEESIRANYGQTNIPKLDDPRRIRREWEKFVVEQGPYDLWVTLNLNGNNTVESARAKVKELLARADNAAWGRRWQRVPDRTFAVGVFEHPTSNLHCHSLWRLPDPGASRLTVDDAPELIEGCWSRLTRGAGSVDVQRVYDMAGAANYMSKEVPFRQQMANWFVSTEFHTRG